MIRVVVVAVVIVPLTAIHCTGNPSNLDGFFHIVMDGNTIYLVNPLRHCPSTYEDAGCP